MDAASPELAKAWQLYFKQRGGTGPSLPPDVLPVIVLDNNERGPYPCAQIFHAGLKSLAGGAGTFNAVGLGNFDGGVPGTGVKGTQPIKSRVVIDRIRVISTDGAAAAPLDLIARVSSVNDEPFNGTLPSQLEIQADDSAGTPLGLGANARLGNVWVGSRQATAFFTTGDQRIPISGITAHEILGPFILNPQMIFYLVQAGTVGILGAFFQGRYYGGA